MPDSFCETPNGVLLDANGMNPVLRWDGLTGQMETAGVLPPLTAPVISGSGVGPIVGDFTAYVRFIDRNDNPSNLSPISNDLTPVSTSGTITDVTNATPIVVTTSAPHGLVTGATIKIEGVGGATGANTVGPITVLTATTFSLDDTVGSGDYTGGGTWSAGVLTIVYSSLPLPTETKVVRRQILRNSDGQAQTYYVDIDTTDLTSTSLSSTRADTDLVTQEAVALLADDGSPLANRYGVPPNWKAVLAAHLDRLFMTVEINYTQGNVATTFGSTTVTGIGTEWTSSLVGRVLYIDENQISYTITAVNTTAQTLTVDVPCQSPSDPYATYAIRPQPAERRLIYYSEAGLYEAMPAVNALAVAEDGDELTGLMPYSSFLYILERRHIYRFTFQSDPGRDGFVFLSTATRGCINNRCWVPVDDMIYMLDEQGIHAFSGGKDTQQVSIPIQDIFRRDGEYSINWAASDYFHGSNDTANQIVRFFVCLSGSYLPRHALAYNYRLKRWWIEQYDVPVGSSCRAELGGRSRVYYGSSAARVLLPDEGNLDGADPSAGTIRGTATSSSVTTLTDSAASFSGLSGFSVKIVDGTGKGQTRIIASHTATVLMLTQPWLTRPDTTSIYQIGGISWLYRSATRRFIPEEQENTRRLEVVFDPLISYASLMTMRLYMDNARSPVVWEQDFTYEEGNGVRGQNGSADLVADLTKPIGVVQKRVDNRKDYFADGPRFVSAELSGVQNAEVVGISEITLDGVVPGGDQQ